jgi:4-hydroxy-tetrahydrodipicolinate synthase
MTCSGVYTALITPFDSKGNLDLEGFRFHVQRQKDANVSGLVVIGTTGEVATLSLQEKEQLVKAAREEGGSLPLMAGCGSYSTEQTIENIHKAAHWGCDYALVISPFYNKPTQEGLYRHFERISEASPIPALVYNIPGRTGVNIEVETLKRIAELPRICGVKECSHLSQITDILFTIKRERPEFSLLCGDDPLTLAVMALGGDGVISGGANLIPHQMVAMVEACKRGEFEKARELNLSLVPIFNALRLESNPIPLKAALQLAGLPSGNPRLPLTPLNSKYLPILEQAWSSVTQTF